MEAFLEASSFSGSSGRVVGIVLGIVLKAVSAFWKVIRRVMRDSKRA